jgi:CelD/BcsL family acetyltransferase involved in cellulose biosynthesis
MFAERQDRPLTPEDTALRLALAEPSALPDDVAWTDLVNNAAEANPFFAPWFLRPAIDHLRGGKNVWLATYYQDEQLCGLLPLAIRDKYGRMPAPHVGNWAHYQCFMGTPLIRSGHEVPFWRALFEALDDAKWAEGMFSITGLEAEGVVHHGLQKAAQMLGRPCPTVHRQRRAMLESTLSPEEYLEANVRGKKRKEWRRLENRLAEMGAVRHATFEHTDDLNHWCEQFLALEAAGWKGERGAALGNTASTRAFFLKMIEGAHRAGVLEMQRLALDDRPIAMLINFLTPPGSWSFKIAHDEELARFSPGVMIELRNLTRVLDDPAIDWMDSCAVENHPMIDALWAERRKIIQVSVQLKGFRRALNWHVCRAAETASAAMRRISA